MLGQRIHNLVLPEFVVSFLLKKKICEKTKKKTNEDVPGMRKKIITKAQMFNPA
jgi:hypothetical protein